MGQSGRAGIVGGIAGLLRFLAAHEEIVEADLMSTYGVDYLDRWRGGLSLRRIRSLLVGLPPGSATATALRGGTVYWPPEAFLADDLRMTVEAAFGVKHPKPHPARPTPGRRPSDPAEYARRVRDLRARIAQRERQLEREGDR